LKYTIKPTISLAIKHRGVDAVFRGIGGSGNGQKLGGLKPLLEPQGSGLCQNCEAKSIPTP